MKMAFSHRKISQQFPVVGKVHLCFLMFSHYTFFFLLFFFNSSTYCAIPLFFCCRALLIHLQQDFILKRPWDLKPVVKSGSSAF